MQRISHISRLLLVVLAVLVCPGVTAEPEICCPVDNSVEGEVSLNFVVGTSRARVEEIAMQWGMFLIRFDVRSL